MPPLEEPDPTRDLTAALILAVVAFLVFAAMLAGLVTKTFRLDEETAAWVGAGVVGGGAGVFAAWAIVLRTETRLGWAARLGGDLALVGLGVALVTAGFATFAAGVI